MNKKSFRLKVLSGLFALAMLVAAGYGVKTSMNDDVQLSDLARANIEALAKWEDPGSGGNTVTCFSSGTYSPGCEYWNCGFCCFRTNRSGVGTSGECVAQRC